MGSEKAIADFLCRNHWPALSKARVMLKVADRKGHCAIGAHIDDEWSDKHRPAIGIVLDLGPNFHEVA